MGDIKKEANGHNNQEPDTRLAKRPRLVEANQVKNKATVILGAQWGDEGKGKVVDMLAGDADIVARCQVYCLEISVCSFLIISTYACIQIKHFSCGSDYLTLIEISCKY
jgi:hypothetical protein